MRKREKDTEGQEPFAPAQPATSGTGKPISPLDIQQKEFRYARFGGYKMRGVDEFLDRVTESMSAVVAENERLRAGGASVSPVLGTPDLDDVGRQADEIIQRARDEAAKILADARAQAGTAAVAVGTGAAATPGERAAINAFLTREKEFLQSLAGLVQDHAGSVKEMAKDARSRGAAPVAAAAATTAAKPTTPPAATPPARSPEKVVATTPPASSSPAASPTSTPASSPAPTEAPAPVRASSPAAADTTISLPRAEEPATAGVRRDGGDDDTREGGDSGDSSLRELFWGEE